MRINRNQKGASLVEFSIGAFLFFITTLSIMEFGLFSFKKWKIEQELESAVKQAENISISNTDINIMKYACNFSVIGGEIHKSGKINDTYSCDKNNLEDLPKSNCGFEIDNVDSCKSLFKGSIDSFCGNVNELRDEDAKEKAKACHFWLSLYRIAGSLDVVSSDQNNYIYGRVGDSLCTSKVGISFPGFTIKSFCDENHENPVEVFTAVDNDINSSNKIFDKLKEGQLIYASSKLPMSFGKFFGVDPKEIKVGHKGAVRMGKSDSLTLITSTETVSIQTETPTNIQTETPTNTMTSIPTCEYYKGNINRRGDGLGTYIWDPFKSYNDKENFDKDAVQCLMEKVNKAFKSSLSRGVYYDEFYVYNALKTFMNDPNFVCTGKWLYFDGGVHFRSNFNWGWNEHNKLCSNGYFYFDKNCNVISENNVDKNNLCGEFTAEFILSSPISLIWDESVNLDEDMTFVKFNLDLSKDYEWSVWRGSNKAPVLVYDPEHKGKVENASQLFGNWTFGGKNKKSKDKIGEAWQNGFEALATLDIDKNGMLEKEELAPLALWFDKNRDAISQDGEIKSLKEMGVKKLYLTNYKKDKKTNHVHMSLGFEKEENGKITTGEMVDWYTIGAQSMRSLVDYFSILKKDDNVKTQESSFSKNLPKSGRPDKETLVQRKFGGVWNWYLEIKEGNKEDYKNIIPEGKFVLTDEADNKVYGVTFVNRLIKKSLGDNLNSFISMFLLEGKFISTNGQDVLHFTRDNKDERAINEAKLSSDGNKMFGTTTIMNVKENKKIVSYNWIAIRER